MVNPLDLTKKNRPPQQLPSPQSQIQLHSMDMITRGRVPTHYNSMMAQCGVPSHIYPPPYGYFLSGQNPYLTTNELPSRYIGHVPQSPYIPNWHIYPSQVSFPANPGMAARSRSQGKTLVSSQQTAISPVASHSSRSDHAKVSSGSGSPDSLLHQKLKREMISLLSPQDDSESEDISKELEEAIEPFKTNSHPFRAVCSELKTKKRELSPKDEANFEMFKNSVLKQCDTERSRTNENKKRKFSSSSNDDPEYQAKRQKNNEAAKRSRDNRKENAQLVATKVAFLTQRLQALQNEYEKYEKSESFNGIS